MIKIKRIYDKASKNDGIRILVDRLWPRGVKKENAHIKEWIKEIGPSNDLRKWFDHDPKKWEQFKKDYIKELKKNQDILNYLSSLSRQSNLTLVYSAKDEYHNQALVIKEYLEKHQNEFK